MSNGTFGWSPTNAPRARRYDDLWFVDREVGWAVNSNGLILKTADGGASWEQQFQVRAGSRGVWLRCVSFADHQRGWVGTTSSQRPMYHTTTGGESRNGSEGWNLVENLPQDGPRFICGLHVVDESVIYASGVNDPSVRSAAVVKSVDGGKTWIGRDLAEQASNLIDIYFPNPDCGWVVGGHTDDPDPTFEKVKPVILYTKDGGRNWENLLADQQDSFPPGTWGWKIQFVDSELGFVSLENETEAMILRTTDGGMSWREIRVSDNADLEGIGFLNEKHGWVGGWGPREGGRATGKSSVTTDSGEQWQNADEIGLFINRFRFLGDPLTVGYAGGERVYKYSQAPVRGAERSAPPTQLLATDSYEHSEGTVAVDFSVPAGAGRVTIHIWNRFARRVRTLLDEKNPTPGARSVVWDCLNDEGEAVPSGPYIYRLTVDETAESRMISVKLP